MDDLELQRRARKRVALKMGFATHLLVYVLVNTGLAVLSLSQGRQWHWGSLLGWGVGLAVHGIVTLVALRGQGLRDRMVDREVQRLRERG